MKVTINGETRECETEELPWGFMVTNHDVELITTNGGKVHIGTVFVDAEGNVIRANYPGMRGNGAGARSKFRHMAWAE